MREETGDNREPRDTGPTLIGDEEYYRNLVEGSPQAIVICGAGKIDFLNPAAARLFGAEGAAEVTGRPLSDFIHPGDREVVARHLQGAEQQGARQTPLRARFLQRGGHVIDVEMITGFVAYLDKPATQSLLRDVTQQNEAEKLLRESEDLYRDLVEHSRDLICTHDLEGRILSINRAVVRVSGYESSFFLNKNLRDFLAPEFQHEFADYLARVRRDGFADGFMQVQTRAGERRVWEYHNTLRTEGVTAPVVRGVAHDVTEVKRAAAQIRRLNKELEQHVTELQTLLEVIPIGIGIAEDPACRNIKVNPYFAKALGISPDANASLSAPQGEKPTNFKVYREGRELSPAELPMQQAASRGAVVAEVEVDVVHEDGRVVKLLEYAAPLFDEAGNPRGAVGAFLDITDRKRAEEALKQSESDYRGLFENAHDAIIILDPEDETVLDANRRACEVYGFSRSEFIGLSLETISKNPALGKVRIQETLNSVPYHHFETAQFRKDGTEMFLEVNASVINYQGKPAILSINRDVTERRLAERERERLLALERAARAEAEAASRAKDEFLATVSHELRTPLTAILGWAGMLRAGRLDPAAAGQALTAIERNARAQAQIVEDLLDMSRIISGKLRIEVKPADLAQVVKAALDVVRPAADAKGIRLQMVVDASLGPVQGDPERLQQVVWNLLSNAVKFTPPGGRIEARLEQAEGDALITVRDSGQGIDPEFLPYVFDRFRQEDGSMTRRHGGLGLGLAIVRHLVEMHGGTVQVESPGAGLGASFTVKLPLRATRSSDKPRWTGPRGGGRGMTEHTLLIDPYSGLAGLRVMVVDDDPETLFMLTRLLEQYGVAVIACASAAQAMTLLRQGTPDVLVSDIAMPEEDGYRLIKAVRLLEAAEGGHLPAVALTAHVRVEDRVRALTAGYQMFVAKPVETSELLAAISALALGVRHEPGT